MTQRFQSDLERDRLTAINLNAITNAFANINLQSGQVDDEDDRSRSAFPPSSSFTFAANGDRPFQSDLERARLLRISRIRQQGFGSYGRRMRYRRLRRLRQQRLEQQRQQEENDRQQQQQQRANIDSNSDIVNSANTVNEDDISNNSDEDNDEDNESTQAVNRELNVEDRLISEILEIKTINSNRVMFNNRVYVKKAVLGVIKARMESDQNISLLNVMNSFKIAVEKYLNEIFEDIDDDDYIQVILKPSLLLHHISTTMMKKTNMSAEVVLALVQSRAQSSFDLKIGDGIKIDVVIVKKKSSNTTNQTGGVQFTRYRYTKNKKGQFGKRTSIVRILNPDDKACLARSLAVLLCKYIESDKATDHMKYIWSKILLKTNQTFKYNNIIRGDGARRRGQKILAEELCNMIGINMNQECGIQEVEKFEDLLQVQIKIIAEDAFNNFIYKGKEAFKNESIKFYIARQFVSNYNSYHYDAITNINKYFCHPFFCSHCDVPYYYIISHRCEDIKEWCFTCYNRDCVADPSYPVSSCEICENSFRSAICKIKHENVSKERCLEVVCNKCYEHIPRKYLKKKKRYQSNIEVLRNHSPCKIECQVCHEKNVKPDHKCYMQSKPFSDHIKKVVYIDFETRQDDGDHVPVYCYMKWKFINAQGETIIGEKGIGLGSDITQEVGDFLFSKDFCDSTIIAHNMRGYDGFFLMKYLIQNNLKPRSLIMNGTKLITFLVPHYQIRIVDSLNFLPMKLSEMPKAFDLDITMKKGFFPHFFTSVEKFNYIGNYPPKEDFGYAFMSLKDQEEFDSWYSEKITENAIFDFNTEMIEYCKQDVEILFQGFEKFRDMVKELSMELLESPSADPIIIEQPLKDETDCVLPNDDEEKSDDKDKKKKKLKTSNYDTVDSCDPLAYVTLAGLCHAIFKACFLKKNTIAVLPPGGYNNHRYSNKQIEWLEYLRATSVPDIKHRINSTNECKIGKYRVDGFSPAKNTVYEFYGCFYHGHKDCISNMNKLNPVSKISYNTLYYNTLSREEDLKNMSYEVVSMWECEWEKFKNENKDDAILQEIVKNSSKCSPLNPREAFRGGRTETNKLFNFRGTLLRYMDVNSLYPAVLMMKLFPVGHPKIVIRNFDYSLQSYFGFIKCDMSPPRKLFHPVLPYSCNGKLLFPLCATCSEQCSCKPCDHSESERMLHGTWFTEEIKLAIEKGYKINKIYQVFHFEQQSTDLFKGYIKAFYKLKVQASGVPKSIQTEEELKTYLKDLKEIEGIELVEDDLKNPNPARRWLTKIMLNSFFGRFGMREDKTINEFIVSEADLDRLFYNSAYTVTSVVPQTEQVALLSYKYSSNDIIPMANNTNIYIAAITTAWARIELFKYLDLLSTNDGENSRCYYCDTDCVIFEPSEIESENPKEGLHLGQLTNELEHDELITTFVSGGPKNYAYRTNKNRECIKVKGFSLNAANREAFSVDNLSDLIKFYISNNTVDGRVNMLQGQDRAKLNEENRKMMMHYHENNHPAIYDPSLGSMSCYNKNKITRNKDTWVVESKGEQRFYYFFFDKRAISASDFDTFPFGY
jgi:hypothetical protein